jgi:hypothetical protein
VNGSVDKVLPVVLRTNDDARRQLFLNVLNLFGNTFGHRVTVLTHQHHRHAEHGLLSTVCRRPGAECVTNLDLGKIFDAQWHDAGGKFHRQLGDLLR